jgi:phenylalanyl-tRNA synthetase beta chain
MTVAAGDPLLITVPTFRPDVTRPADLIEEIARVHGFDKFDATLPTGPAGGLTVEQRRQRELNSALVGMGISQAINLPFVSVEDLRMLGVDIDDKDLLAVKNPLREEESKLRPSLLPGLLGAVRYNRSHGLASVALFETGKVFFSTPDPHEPRLPEQHNRLAWAVTGDVGISTLHGTALQADADFSLAVWHGLAATMGVEAELQAATHPGFHPGRCAAVLVDDQVIGHVGELSPAVARSFEVEGRVAAAELELDPLLAPVQPVVASEPSPYPHVDFDLSFVVELDMSAAELVSTTSAAAQGLIESARVFDEFKGESLGENRKALAITYRLRAPDRTLEQKEIASIRQSMIDAAASIGARLRGAE